MNQITTDAKIVHQTGLGKNPHVNGDHEKSLSKGEKLLRQEPSSWPESNSQPLCEALPATSRRTYVVDCVCRRSAAFERGLKATTSQISPGVCLQDGCRAWMDV